jgi:hypothetical protein
MTVSTSPATPGSTTTAPPATGLAADIKKVLADMGSDIEGATSSIVSLVGNVETSAPASAMSSFIGTVLKSGRGGAVLAILASAVASVILGPVWAAWAMVAVAALILTSASAVSMFTGSTKGEPGWALILLAVAAAALGAAGLWVFDNVTVAMLSGFITKL